MKEWKDKTNRKSYSHDSVDGSNKLVLHDTDTMMDHNNRKKYSSHVPNVDANKVSEFYYSLGCKSKLFDFRVGHRWSYTHVDQE